MSDTTTKIPVKFKGLVRWASVPPNPARKPAQEYIDPKEPDNTSYSIEVECSKDEHKRLIKEGLSSLTQLKEDEVTGKTYLKVKTSKVRGDITFPDPFVIDAQRDPVNVAIGNGSTAIVIAELVPVRKGKALRLKGVQVLNLIPFTGGASKYDDLLEGDIEPVNNTLYDDVDTSNLF